MTILFRLVRSKEWKECREGKKGRKEDTVAENDGIHLLTATSTPELTCSSRGKTQAAHGQPETDDGLFGWAMNDAIAFALEQPGGATSFFVEW